MSFQPSLKMDPLLPGVKSKGQEVSSLSQTCRPPGKVPSRWHGPAEFFSKVCKWLIFQPKWQRLCNSSQTMNTAMTVFMTRKGQRIREMWGRKALREASGAQGRWKDLWLFLPSFPFQGQHPKSGGWNCLPGTHLPQPMWTELC